MVDYSADGSVTQGLQRLQETMGKQQDAFMQAMAD